MEWRGREGRQGRGKAMSTLLYAREFINPCRDNYHAGHMLATVPWRNTFKCHRIPPELEVATNIKVDCYHY